MGLLFLLIFNPFYLKIQIGIEKRENGEYERSFDFDIAKAETGKNLIKK